MFRKIQTIDNLICYIGVHTCWLKLLVELLKHQMFFFLFRMSQAIFSEWQQKCRFSFSSEMFVNPRPAGGGPKGPPPCGFSQIAPEVLGISLWNLPYLSGQQFHTLCQKIMTQVIIGQPWVTSEWRHVSTILISKMGLRESPPLVQF